MSEATNTESIPEANGVVAPAPDDNGKAFIVEPPPDQTTWTELASEAEDVADEFDGPCALPEGDPDIAAFLDLSSSSRAYGYADEIRSLDAEAGKTGHELGKRGAMTAARRAAEIGRERYEAHTKQYKQDRRAIEQDPALSHLGKQEKLKALEVEHSQQVEGDVTKPWRFAEDALGAREKVVARALQERMAEGPEQPAPGSVAALLADVLRELRVSKFMQATRDLNPMDWATRATQVIRRGDEMTATLLRDSAWRCAEDPLAISKLTSTARSEQRKHRLARLRRDDKAARLLVELQELREERGHLSRVRLEAKSGVHFTGPQATR